MRQIHGLRGVQFGDRLGWAYRRDRAGGEHDQYDGPAAVHLAVSSDAGALWATLRLRPMVRRTMLRDHFAPLAAATGAPGRGWWEVSRLCRARGAPRGAGAALVLVMALLGREIGAEGALGLFSAPMLRVYRRLGWAPEVLATQGSGAEALAVGRWRFGAAPIAGLAARAGV
ncbi:MAG: hypothetical protein D6832_01545, partial [Alphaproteobacteria bacterium]